MPELKFLCVGGAQDNTLAKLLEETGVKLDFIEFEKYLARKTDEYTGMLFMPGYFDWDEVKDKEVILRKIKKFVDSGASLYSEYVQCPDYLFLHNAFKFKQNYPNRPVALERFAVRKEHYITSDFEEETILPVRNCSFLPGMTKDMDALASFAVVRGVHKVECGFPHEWEMFPALCVGRKHREVFATFELSKYRELEFPLASEWEKLLRKIVLYLLPENIRSENERKFSSTPLPKTWSSKGKVAESERKQRYGETLDSLMSWYKDSGVMPCPDGSGGVMEGFRSFDHRLLPILRPDCNAQIALLMELYGRLSRDESYSGISSNIIKFLWENGFQDKNPEHNTCGLWKFYQDYEDFPLMAFCNDNSWTPIALLGLFGLTGNKDYLDSAEITAKNIYHWRLLEKAFSISGKKLNELGDKYIDELKGHYTMNPFVPSMYALYGHYSGNSEFIERAVEIAENYVDHPTSAQTNIFPIFMYSLLFKITGKTSFKEKIIERMRRFEPLRTKCGGVRNILYNEAKARDFYGIMEIDATHQSTDEIVDILYVNGPFAFCAYAAWKATGDEYCLNFFHEVMDFICSIQITSSNPKLNGAWMRGYDYRHNDYNGNNGDMDWGPFCVESGWCNSWIGQTLAMYLMECDAFF